MQNRYRRSLPAILVTAHFGSSLLRFSLPNGATLADIAAHVERLGERNGGKPTAVYLTFSIARRLMPVGQTISCQANAPKSFRADDCRRISVRWNQRMNDMEKRRTTAAPPHVPQGLAFEIADLVLVRSWAELHEFRMVVRLDHGADGEEYEEVIAIQRKGCTFCWLIMWRNADSVIVQPLVGRRQQYGSVSEALERLVPKRAVVFTDITATAWPAG